IKIVQGRWFRRGLRELVVGQALQESLGNLGIGDRVELPGGPWKIVGSFTSGNRSHDMELLGDAETVITAFDADQFSSMTALLRSSDAFARFRSALVGNPALAVEVERERDYYVKQSQSLALILRVVAYLVGAIMAVGATFGALNAMYSIVVARSWEIATLRAMGFGSGTVLISILIEALALAVAGALVAATASWLLFNGTQIIQGNGAGGSVVYALSITPRLALTGTIWALLIGTFGAFPPALKAARLPVAAALRTLR
ncbi:MAG: ABC transporter permease, partial [Steroidobacteraceae bacterium]